MAIRLILVCSLGVGDEDAAGVESAGAAHAAHDDLRRDAGAVLHGIRVPRLLHCAPVPSVFGLSL